MHMCYLNNLAITFNFLYFETFIRYFKYTCLFQFYDNAWPKFVQIKSIVERNQKKKLKIGMFNYSTLLHAFFCRLHHKHILQKSEKNEIGTY